MKRWSWIAKSHKCCFIIASLFATIAASRILVQTGYAKGNTETPQAFAHPAFRYVIIYDDPALNGVGRDLHVLMDPSEFNEANLRSLFGLLTQRFKSVPGFTVYIETSLQDIQTPEEREGPGYSEAPSNPKAFQHPSAMIEHSPRADTLYVFLPSRATDHPRKIDLRSPR